MYIINMDLPNYLPGYPPMFGVKQELPKYYQGDLIKVFVPISTDISQTCLRAFLAESLTCNWVLWAGVQNNGSIEKVDGGINVIIKEIVSRWIPSGTYYIAVLGEGPKDVGVWNTLGQTTISITPTAGSPYPVVHQSRSFIQSSFKNNSLLYNNNIAWYEGPAIPSITPRFPDLPAFYCGANGSFYIWSVIDRLWLALI